MDQVRPEDKNMTYAELAKKTGKSEEYLRALIPSYTRYTQEQLKQQAAIQDVFDRLDALIEEAKAIRESFRLMNQ